ncbi:hypothetical protein D1B31_11805 [Neobacillus notoginsengisoli]|uniref:Uncharacterized protein n=1 Tax=Neobacillus notoginsengisoli TaxID=1578198 RepID=A0A417YT55_9BACI|nr:hypothetical protein [Neobacillus notoginsengisoli]RHW40237.1 hypothetical protein D1B31_11805 [Neobacillus notoginsengisoli]
MGRLRTAHGFFGESLSEGRASSDSETQETSFSVRTWGDFGQLTAFSGNHCPKGRHLRTTKRKKPLSLSEHGVTSDSSRADTSFTVRTQNENKPAPKDRLVKTYFSLYKRVGFMAD